MNRLLVVAVSWCVVGCTVPDPTNGIDRWSVNGFQIPDDDPLGTEVLGRWERRDLLIVPGKTMPFRRSPFQDGGVNTTNNSVLTIWPAFAASVPMAFVITDIWANQPRPWVQPVYMGVKNYDVRPNKSIAASVFPVAPGASFYSPYWRAEYYDRDAVGPDYADGGFTRAQEVLNSQIGLSAGPLVYCPLIPDGVRVTNPGNEKSLSHPFAVISYGDVDVTDGYVAGSVVHYLGFNTGVDLAPSQGDVVVDSPMYLFTRVLDRPEYPLALPPVLVNDPIHHSLVRVVDVQLPDDAMVFVPAANHEQIANFTTEDGGQPYAGLNLRWLDAVDAQVEQEYTLRVFMDAGCLAPDAGFPHGCDWLDSAARIEQLSSSLRNTSAITAAIGVLKEAP